MGLEYLSALTLSRAINDICPDYSSYDEASKKKKIKERLHKYEALEAAYDAEWEEMEESAEQELKLLLAERDLVFSHIEKRRNSKKIEEKIRVKERKRDEKLLQLTKKNTPEVEIQEVRDKFNSEIEELRLKDNSKKVDARLEHSRSVWDRKLTKLKNRYKIKEAGYDIRRNQKDRIRMSLQWFLEDFEEVLKLCRNAKWDVKNCYYVVKERLDLLGRDCPELEEIINKIERHEY